MALKSKQLRLKPPRRRARKKHQTIFNMIRHFWRILWPAIKRFTKSVWALPPRSRVVVIPVLLFFLWLGINWGFQALNKPSEMLFPLDHSLNKHPVETWKQYESLFREHATTIITPEFLAALAQVETAGNPVARTYWRWQGSWNPLEWYRPASSAVGMFQITDGTFQQAKRYCIHDHKVFEDGPWHNWQSCWFNSLYTRVLPSHAIELTSALLDRQVSETIRQRRAGSLTLQQKQDLAAVIHLCGAGSGSAYAARGHRLTPHQRCGDHSVKLYLVRINALKQAFLKPKTRNKTIRKAN